jgi:hypothetical protein
MSYDSRQTYYFIYTHAPLEAIMSAVVTVATPLSITFPPAVFTNKLFVVDAVPLAF